MVFNHICTIYVGLVVRDLRKRVQQINNCVNKTLKFSKGNRFENPHQFISDFNERI